MSLDDELYEEARRIAFETRRTLGDVLNELLSEGLKSLHRTQEPRVLGKLLDATPPEIVEALERPV